jgi:hypothetical protein
MAWMRSAVVIVKLRGGEADPLDSFVIVDVSLASHEVEVAGAPFQGLPLAFCAEAERAGAKEISPRRVEPARPFRAP